MKKIIYVMAIFIILALGMTALTGCNNKEDQNKKDDSLAAAAGTYKGIYTKYVGDSTRIENEEFSLELKADGTGTSNRDGASYKLTWQLKGTAFTMTEKFAGITIDYNGTLEDGKLDIFNGDKNNDFTYEYVYEKE